MFTVDIDNIIDAINYTNVCCRHAARPSYLELFTPLSISSHADFDAIFILIYSRVNGYINSSFGPFKMNKRNDFC